MRDRHLNRLIRSIREMRLRVACVEVVGLIGVMGVAVELCNGIWVVLHVGILAFAGTWMAVVAVWIMAGCSITLGVAAMW